jgi:hypothetical protein
MHEDDLPELHQNPYHPFDETERHRAFQNGWAARREREPRTANPHNLSRVGKALAWLDGWTAAREQERDPDADPWRAVVGRRSGTSSGVPAP